LLQEDNVLPVLCWCKKLEVRRAYAGCTRHVRSALLPTKISQFDLEGAVQQDVLGLDVAVDEALRRIKAKSCIKTYGQGRASHG